MTAKKKAVRASGANIPEEQRSTQQLITRVPVDVLNEFDKLVLRGGTTRCALLREVVENYVKRHAK